MIIDVICIGSAVLDITAYPIGNRENWKEKQRISDIRIQPGGDAVNQSLRLADLGLNAALAACVGTDQNGAILRSALEERGVRTDYLRTKPDHATTTALVLVDGQGERRTFSVKGAHSELAKEDCAAGFAADCRAVSLASLFSMPKLEADGLEELLRAARRRGVLIFADLASDKQKQGLDGIRRFLPYLDYFLPSVYDALEMTGAKSVQEAAERYRECGAGHVIIKCGKDGCFYLSEEKAGWIPAVPVKAVDTTGAGDCMAALFISRILAGDGIERACRYACAGASYSVLFPGASEKRLTREMIESWMAAGIGGNE